MLHRHHMVDPVAPRQRPRIIARAMLVVVDMVAVMEGTLVVGEVGMGAEGEEVAEVVVVTSLTGL